MRQSLNPLSLIRDGFDWTGSTQRLPFMAFFAVMTAITLATGFVVSTGAFPRLALSGLFLSLSVLTIPFGGHVMRRLNDLGWPGWQWFILLIPVVGFFFCLMLCTRYGGRYRVVGGFWRFLGGLTITVVAVALFLRIFWAPFLIPAGSMKPTLLPGDYILASLGRYEPEMGDVIILRHPTTDRIFVKRVVAGPGDRVGMVDGVLHVNDIPAAMSDLGEFVEVMQRQGPAEVLPRCENGAVAMGAACRKSVFREMLVGGQSHLILNIGMQMSDDTTVFEVPQGHYFVLGDNRDNSTDSRFPASGIGLGFVPQEAILGRADYVVFSSPGPYLGAFWTWRPDRFLVGIE